MRFAKSVDDPESPCQGHHPDPDTPLVFDLFGPFVVQFQQGSKKNPGAGIICAPLCVDHHANVLTDNNDFSVAGLPAPPPSGAYGKDQRPYIYTLEIGTCGPHNFEPPDSHAILRVRYDSQSRLRLNSAGTGIASKCHFVMRVPMPNRIAALRPELIWMHRNNAAPKLWVIDEDAYVFVKKGQEGNDGKNIVNSSRGRGLRLIYDRCPKPPSIRPTSPDPDAARNQDPPTDFTGLCALTRGFPVGPDDSVPRYYSITLRYADTAPQAVPNAVEDAYTCFQAMRCLFDETPDNPCDFTKWRVDFGHLPVELENKLIGGPRPRDCSAAVLAMQDW
jgi:hypothetical protein